MENLELLDFYNGWQIVAVRTRSGKRAAFGRWNSKTGLDPFLYGKKRDKGEGFTALKIIHDYNRNRSTELLLWMPRKGTEI